MELVVKTFEQLTTKELYEILQVRAEIFVVEQNCIYQDLDRTDYRSWHFFFEQDGCVEAYLRAFWKDGEERTLQIGRVLTRCHGQGLGGRLLKEALEVMMEKLCPQRMYLEAQCYAVGFYEKEGFRVCSEEFLEDGIPHVCMERIGRDRL